MLPWTKPWLDWVMPDFWLTHRNGPQPQALHYSYEKAGLRLHDQPIPWNAEVVVVEAAVRLPPSVPRRKSDFQLNVPGRPTIQPDAVRYRDSKEDCLSFRFPPPSCTISAELIWRGHRLAQLTLPMLDREKFIQNLRLDMPTLFVRLGDQSVACQTFVSTQCRGLMASGVLTSPTSLVPLLDLGLRVDLRSEKAGHADSVSAQLTSSQLAGQRALVNVVPRRFPRRIGTWVATWLLGDFPLAIQRVRAISQRHFHQSLRVVDSRFIVQNSENKVSVVRQIPPVEALMRMGPCFLVDSTETGMAGACKMQVRMQLEGTNHHETFPEQEVLITDGPTLMAPGTVDVGDFCKVKEFELCLRSKTLGAISSRPAPAASFTNEGGLKTSQDFTWSLAADEELHDRLSRLLESRSK